MKKIPFLTAICFALFSLSVSAQAPIALHHAGTTTLFSGSTALTQAYTAAANGDTLYLPGGGFTALDIQKSLTIFGAGFHPDSAQITGKTIINGNIYFRAPVPNFYIEGVEINGVLSNYAPANKVDGLIVKNCKINGAVDFYASATDFSNNILLTNCVLGSLNFSSYTSNVLVTNCIIQGTINSSTNNLFANNLMLVSNRAFNSGNYGNTIRNNIFIGTNPVSYSSSETVQNNLFLASGTPNYGTTPINTDGNYFDAVLGFPVNTIFVNQTGNAFNFEHNYHLLPAVLTQYLGTDGTQVGIYGGYHPVKEGWIPSSPHIQKADVPAQTNSDGKLQTGFKTQAQSN
ncbi:hypothetical protein FACS189413_15840 [Bacteroidia bacterium]|nr:hypothetical protein FACS189413_15840 [Bacteroidia bacterium]